MKRETQIQSIDGNTIKMADGTAWVVDDPINAPHALPFWLPLSKVETEDFGLHPFILHVQSGRKLKAKKQ